MKREYRKKWIVCPEQLPAVVRRCPKCGQKTEFENSGRFRVNANGRMLDVWLIYRCAVCETSWNMTVWERVDPKSLEREEYEGFLKNDRELAVRYGCSRQLFAKNKAEPAKGLGGGDIRCWQWIQPFSVRLSSGWRPRSGWKNV